MAVVTDPVIINPLDFIKEVLEVRFPNPFVPDTPQRISCDASQKIFVRFGETIKAYITRPDLDVSTLTVIPLVFAGWCRYMVGINDNGDPFTLNPDPQMENSEIWNCHAPFGNNNYHELLQTVLSNSNIFGADLYKIGLGEKTEQFFKSMMEGKGAVRRTLTNI